MDELDQIADDLADMVGRELDPRAFDRARFYNDMEYGFYQHRHMYQINQVFNSATFRAFARSLLKDNTVLRDRLWATERAAHAHDEMEPEDG